MLKYIGFLFVGAEQWRSLFGRIALSILVLAATHSLYASASTVASPVISVGVSDTMGDGTMIIRNKGLPYYFGGLVEWPANDVVWSTGADIYFGVILPDRMTVLTWAPSNGVIVLNEGLVPFVRATSNKHNFHTGIGLPNGVNYTVSGNEPSGMCLLFLLLVTPGGDPGDPRQWGPVGMQPFFFMKPL